MSRGNYSQEIFLKEEDYRDFLKLLEEAKVRFACRIYAYSLMPNHFHLLVELEAAPLSRMMQWLLTCHSKRFNWRHGRRGHLFSGRYKSISCVDDAYFKQLLRYIHLNPVRGGCVARPEEWPWSGHCELLGTRSAGLIDAAFPLRMFDERPAIARDRYAQFIESGLADCQDTPSPFELSTEKSLPEVQEKLQAPADDEDDSARIVGIATKLCLESSISMDGLRGPSRTNLLARARTQLAQCAVAQGIAPSRIAAFLNRDCSLISRAVRLRGAPRTKVTQATQ